MSRSSTQLVATSKAATLYSEKPNLHQHLRRESYKNETSAAESTLTLSPRWAARRRFGRVVHYPECRVVRRRRRHMIKLQPWLTAGPGAALAKGCLGIPRQLQIMVSLA
jgi:hypothetical protein